MKASASLACRKGDGRFQSKTDFSAFLRYVGFGSRAAHQGQAARRPLQAAKPTKATTRLAYAVRNTGAGGCDGRISANATCTMPPARPSATPMRQAMV
ncbi:hypothetical protein ACVIW2_000739 [Bradyrhizobium huanghuaihaiense]